MNTNVTAVGRTVVEKPVLTTPAKIVPVPMKFKSELPNTFNNSKYKVLEYAIICDYIFSLFITE